MYSPVKDGIEKTVQSVQYTEIQPPGDLSDVVHSYWELKTTKVLPNDFHLHVLPDACVNILFNLQDTNIAGITALHTTFEVLNLGTSFHYAGVQLLPGVWKGSRDEIFDKFVGEPYAGSLPLVTTADKLDALDVSAHGPVLSDLVRHLMDKDIIVQNPVTATILHNLDDIHTVADMAIITGVSARQLQRTLKQTTGFSPHDLLKVLRLQQSFTRGHLIAYTDQSHFIHSFRNITGYTPAQYAKSFDV